MKTRMQIAVALMLVLVCCVALVACGHEHATYATDWSQDGENHWHACTEEDCTEVSDKAAHVYDNACDADCNVCGATRTPAAHVYDNACDADCNVCGATRTPAAHVYDNACDATCNVCGATRTVGAHSYVHKKVGTTYYKECSACQHSITTSVSEDRFANAMAFKDEEGSYYMNLEIVSFDSTTKAFECKVTESSAYYYCITADNLETIWTNENGKGVIYTKKTAYSKWVRTEQESEYTDFALCIFPKTLLMKQENVTYDKIKSNYSGNDFAYHTAYTLLSTVSQIVTLNFEDGKLVNASYMRVNSETGSIMTGTRTVTYGNAVIEIPTDAVDDVRETGYYVPYSTAENKFSLNTIILQNSTPQWFVIDITDSDASDIDGVFTLTQETDATLTVAVEDANGNAITNEATGNGEISLKGLSAGRYFIKITADKNCKGNLSIEYADAD